MDNGFVPVVLIILVVYLSIGTEYFLTTSNLQVVVSQMVILAVVAFGSTFVIIGGDLDLSVGSASALASVVGAMVMAGTGSVVWGLVGGLTLGVVIGLVNGVLVAFLEVPAFIATLGTLVILRGIALFLTNGGIVSDLPPELGQLNDLRFLGLDMGVWLMIAVFIAFVLMQRQSSLGLMIFAVGGNREAARLAGVPVRAVRMTTFVMSAVMASLAGLVLLTRVESGQPNGSQALELYAIAAVVIGGTSLYGGRGSVIRTAVGVALIVVMSNGLDILGVSYDAQQIVIGIVFILAATVDFFRRRLQKRESRRAAARSVSMNR
jgi:ribose transport system permease protein